MNGGLTDAGKLFVAGRQDRMMGRWVKKVPGFSNKHHSGDEGCCNRRPRTYMPFFLSRLYFVVILRLFILYQNFPGFFFFTAAQELVLIPSPSLQSREPSAFCLERRDSLPSSAPTRLSRAVVCCLQVPEAKEITVSKILLLLNSSASILFNNQSFFL